MRIRSQPKPAAPPAPHEPIPEPQEHVVAVQNWLYRGCVLSTGDRLPRNHWLPRMFPYLFEKEG